MKLFKFLFLFLIINSFVLYGCAEVDSSSSISVEELKKEMKNDKDIVILDVRTEQEFVGEMNKIPEAVHIPLQEIETRYNELEKYKDKEIMVICRTGRRSGIACDFLKTKGYNVKNVEGGMVKYIQ